MSAGRPSDHGARDEFVPVGDALARISDELGLVAPGALQALEDQWADVVGADVAAHTRLDALHDGVATITADGPLWASQLRYLEAAIVEGATAIVGPGVVVSVRVRVGG